MNDTALFSQAEQTGQPNLLSQINERAELIFKLRRAQHTYYNDPGHGWLKVQFQDLLTLGIVGQISAYSYRQGDVAYLEEDMDASTYINALFGGPLDQRSGVDMQAFKVWQSMINDLHGNNDSFIRSLPSF